MRRSTVLMLVLFGLLAGLTWYMQQPDNSIKQALATSTVQPAITSEMVISPNGGGVSRIEIKDAAGSSIVLDKSSGDWVINDDKARMADQTLAETAASLVYTLQIITKLEKTPDPAGTGLDEPNYSVSITQQTGVTRIKIGKLSATGRGYYVEAVDGSVYIVSKDGVETLVNNLINPPYLPTAAPILTETPGAPATKAP